MAHPPHPPTCAVEFPGACLPQAGPILRAFVSCEGSGFRPRAPTTAPVNSCLATWSPTLQRPSACAARTASPHPSVCT